MTELTARFDADRPTTKDKLTHLVADLGVLQWKGDRGSFEGTGMAKGVKGEASVADDGAGTVVKFGYKLPLKLRVVGGTVDRKIREGLTEAGGQISDT